MVEVICDTSFLIHLANRRILNIDLVPAEIGNITFVVPEVVRTELLRLSGDRKKGREVQNALDYAGRLKTVPIGGTFADRELLRFASKNRIIVATMDRDLKKGIRDLGCTILTLSKDRIVVES